MHKTCFMTNGFSQVEGIDFNERFPPIAWLKLIEIMFVVATIQDLEVYQMDVKNYFYRWKSFQKDIYAIVRGFCR
jgi:hypothetical protein